MKILIKIFIFSIFMFNNCINLLSDNIIKEMEISPRIGYEINSENKSYFNFFPNVKNFKSAKLFKLNDSILFFQIEKNSQQINNYDTLKLTTKEFSTLQTILDNNEYVIWDGSHENTLNIPWSPVISKIIQPRMRYSNEWNEIKFELRDKSIVQGNLLWADSSFLIIGPMNLKYDWKNVTNQYKVYHFSEIQNLLLPINREFMGREDIYLIHLLFLQNLSSFSETDGNIEYLYNPEFQELIKSKLNTFDIKQSTDLLSLDEVLIFKQKKFTINMDFAINTIYANTSPFLNLYCNSLFYDNTPSDSGWFTNQYELSETSLPNIQTNLPRFTIEYKILDHINLGLDMEIFQKNFNYISLYAKYTKTFHNPYKFDFFNNFEISYNLGAILGNLNNEVAINVVIHRGIDYNIKDKFSYNNLIYGAVLGFQLSYFITDYLTIDFKGLANLIIPIKYEKMNLKLNKYKEIYLDEIFVRNRSIDYSNIEARFGLGIKL